MILITGGAGMIGSNLIASLNERGQSDIIIADTMLHPNQWKNLAKRKFSELLVPRQPINLIDINAVIHLAAITDTTETNQEAVLETNYAAPVGILEVCRSANIPFIYASSAAVYGNPPLSAAGGQGFSESATNLHPLNLYAWSKLLFDQHVMRQLPCPKSKFEQVVDSFEGKDALLRSQVVGLRFFNVYGPNEYHKGKMASLIAQHWGAPKKPPYWSDPHKRPFELFGSTDRERYAIPPMRDFVYVEDAVNVILWMIDHPEVSGIFNVGTGEAKTFESLARAAFGWQEGQEKIDYVTHPLELQPAYQFFTQADLTRLRRAGCDVPFRPIEEGVRLYVEKYLSQPDRYR